MEQTKNIKQNKFLTLKLFILFFLLIIITTGSFLFTIYRLEVKNERYILLEMEKNITLSSVDPMRHYFENIITDLFVLKGHYELTAYLSNHDERTLNNLSIEYKNFSEAKKIYDQVRYIDEFGQEVTRVNYRDNMASIAPKHLLQNKSDRYYFTETNKLNEDQIYISPLDLNVESGKVEEPPRPMLRFSAPIFSENSQRRGLVILNFNAKKLLDDIHSKYFHNVSELSILNQDGYWVKSIYPEKEWGFMYENKKDLTLARQDPILWAKLNSNISGQIVTADGVYTYNTVFPYYLADMVITRSNIDNYNFQNLSNDKDFFKIISFIPNSKLSEKSNSLLIYLLLIFGGFIIVGGIGSLVLARAISSRDRAEKNAENLNDILRVINKILRHDILNKLTGIKMNMELHRKYGEDVFLDYTDESVKSSINLIMQMRELEAAVVNKGVMERYDIVKLLKEIKKEHRIAFTIIGKGFVKADAALRPVFDNIIRNAIVHGGTKKMKIEIKNFKHKVEIKMADYGSGIPDNIKGKIFDEGFKSGKSGGTGLGLYIVKKTIDRYGGTVSVVDNKPKGAMFVITLPK